MDVKANQHNIIVAKLEKNNLLLLYIVWFLGFLSLCVCVCVVKPRIDYLGIKDRLLCEQNPPLLVSVKSAHFWLVQTIGKTVPGLNFPFEPAAISFLSFFRFSLVCNVPHTVSYSKISHYTQH